MQCFRWALTRLAPRFGWPLLLATVIGLGPVPALAEYKLHAGDSLEVSVTGVAALRQRSVIGVEGKIVLPLVGPLSVAGLTVPEARELIAERLANKVYREATNEGREVPHLILPDEIVVSVAEYRPVYVDGDVVRPGEYPFRPGMTVRQALAVAGGIGLARLGGTNPYLQAADLRAEYETLWTEFAREQARSWRLRTQLGETTGKFAEQSPIPGSIMDRFIEAETEQYKARLADRQKDTAYLKSAIAKTDSQLSALAEKKSADEKGNRAAQHDFDKVRELSERGLATMTRLSEARRVALLSSNQMQQTNIDLSAAERQRGEYVRQLAKLESEDRVATLRELQESELRLAQLSARLKGAGEKLAYTGVLKSQLVQGLAAQPVITVHRRSESGAQSISDAGETLALEPGDVVEVALKDEKGAEIGPSSKLIQ